jgi:phage/plasmid-associated DNA primase
LTFAPAANEDFENVTLSVQEFAKSITLGRAFSPQLKDGKRTSKNFLQSSYLGLDIDSGLTLEEVLADPFIQKYACIIYPTENHQKEKIKPSGKVEPPCDRFRVIFVLKNPITDPVEYQAACRGLFKRYPQADRSTGDPGRLFCGSVGCNPYVFEHNVLPPTEVEALIKAGRIERSEIVSSPWVQGAISTDEVRKMLACLPLDDLGNVILSETSGHEGWIRIVFAVASAFDPDTAFNLINEWCPDDKGGSYIRTLINGANGDITIATLIYHAEKNGYRLPMDLERKRSEKGRTPGQVVMEDLLAGGGNLVTITDLLYRYDDMGLYRPVNMAALEASILKYFNTYQTCKNGKTAFATAKQAQFAMDFIIGICKPSSETIINPPGLNFQNGYLRLSYDFKGEPVFALTPHSPDYIFTYRIEAKWEGGPSQTDLKFFDDALAAILSVPSEQKIFMRTIAAALDLPYVRAHLPTGRTVKALILEGEGTNGKDTLHVWTKELFGYHGMSCVSLRTFKDADNGDLFGMVSLATSLVNWASENGKILLDDAECLKAFITGDDGVRAARKHKDEFPICPKAVSIFNMNKLPAAKAAMEATSARFNIIRLQNVFKEHPDPNNPRHKKGNAQFKEDLEFIRAKILPAYAYRIVEAYKELLREGIDYSSTDGYMNEVRKESDHLHMWLEDQNLALCAAEEGISSSDCYKEFYLPWAIGEGYAEKSHESGFLRFHHHHDLFDKAIPHQNKLLQRLKDAFPTFEHKRTNKGTMIGLKSIGTPRYLYEPSVSERMDLTMGR